MRETWQDWADRDAPADVELVPLNTILARLERIGPVVKEGTVRFWIARGVLPGPTRTTKGNRYPWWYLDLLLTFLIHQGESYIPDLDAHLRRQVAAWSLARDSGDYFARVLPVLALGAEMERIAARNAERG